MWIPMTDDQAIRLRNILSHCEKSAKDRNLAVAEELHELTDRVDRGIKSTEENREVVKTAQSIYSDPGYTEFDDDATVSAVPDSASYYVLCWQWLTDEEVADWRKGKFDLWNEERERREARAHAP